MLCWRRAFTSLLIFWRRYGAKIELESFWRRFFNFGAVALGAVWRQSSTQSDFWRRLAPKLTSTPSFLAPVLAPKDFGAVSDVLAP